MVLPPLELDAKVRILFHAHNLSKLHIFFCHFIHLREPTSFTHFPYHSIKSQMTHFIMKHLQKSPTSRLGHIPSLDLLAFNIHFSIQDIIVHNVIIVYNVIVTKIFCLRRFIFSVNNLFTHLYTSISVLLSFQPSLRSIRLSYCRHFCWISK